jgi:hypothetical protein
MQTSDQLYCYSYGRIARLRKTSLNLASSEYNYLALISLTNYLSVKKILYYYYY